MGHSEGSQPVSASGISSIDVEELFRLAADSLPLGLLLADAAGRIVWVNQQLERQFGYGRTELIGRPVDVLIQPGPDPAAARGRRRDGSELAIEVKLTPVPNGEAPLILRAVTEAAPPRIVDPAQEAIASQLAFEELMAELSFKFINLPPGEVLATMRDALRRIGEALDLDRTSFFRIEANGALLAPISWWREPHGRPPVVTAGPQQFPWAVETLLAGRTVVFARVDEIPNATDRAGYTGYGIKSAVSVPLLVGGRVVGAIGANMVRAERRWTPRTLHSLQVIATVFANVVARMDRDEALRTVISDAERDRDRLQTENLYLRREFHERVAGGGAIVGKTAAIGRVLEQIHQVAATDSTVLLLGETGTGKELLATRLHELSARRGRTMVRVNCAAIPAGLIESELFGRERGAFTDAVSRQVGRFELADHSTIFLDEIGDLPAEVQVKLLRVLEERQIERLGSARGIKVDVRIVAATHQNLEQRVLEDAFREDLFYRLNVFPIQVPPLRDRADDVPLLVWHFVEEFSRTLDKKIDAIPRENLAALQAYAWPGNIRELRNVVERAMIAATGSRLTIALPRPHAPAPAPGKAPTRLADVEREHILSVLESTGWRIRGAGGAAERLGLRPTTLETRMARIGLKRRPAKPDGSTR
jgi:transcriptional regulator with GAF, ATPase, and Fis domain